MAVARKDSPATAHLPSRPRDGRPLFGAHLSVAGGLANAFDAGVRVGCECLQVFVKNQRQWRAKPLTAETIEAYRQAQAAADLHPVVAHAGYLINLASPAESLRNQSVDALLDELTRCHQLGIPFLVLHPGAHWDDGVEAGIVRVVAGLDRIHDLAPDCSCQVLLETTAGQGSALGHDLGHLAQMLGGVRNAERLGVCVDTCHVFAAGYDLTRPAGHERLMDDLTRWGLLERVRCLHLNDSLRECGSRVDRHEHIGQGKIGKEGFRRVVNEPRFAGLPMILETPKGTDGRGTHLDKVNLGRLRRLLAS